MYWRRFLREITGRVLLDSSSDTRREPEIRGVEGIGIILYRTIRVSRQKQERGRDIIISRQVPVFQTVSGKNGRYRFIVPDGIYTVALDLNTVPAGIRAEKTFFDTGRGFRRGFDFKLKQEAYVEREQGEDNSVFLVKDIPGMTFEEETALEFRYGIIDEKTKVKRYLNILFEGGSMPRARGKKLVKCGTSMMEEVVRYINRQDADNELVERAKGYIEKFVPELDKVFISPSGFFRFHYTTKGKNAVPADKRDDSVPYYVRMAAKAFDESKRITCDVRGFRKPVFDNGEEVLDVYIYDLEGKYGIAVAKQIYKNTSTGIRTASCFICMDNSYSADKGFKSSREDCVKVTAAHEFFHAVQYAYNVDADTWWKEASATWNEDEVYNSVNDYIRYLKSVFLNPHRSLEEYTYGGVAFVKCLCEKTGGYGIVKKIWEMQGRYYDDSTKSIDRALVESYGYAGIGRLFDTFTAWNYNPAQYYAEGELWNQSPAIKNTHSEFPVKDRQERVNHLAANYQLFKWKEKKGTLKIVIQADGMKDWGFKLQKRKTSNGLCDITSITMAPDESRAEVIIPSFSENYSEICFIPANLEKELDDLQYTYFAEILTEDTSL